MFQITRIALWALLLEVLKNTNNSNSTDETGGLCCLRKNINRVNTIVELRTKSEKLDFALLENRT